MLVFGLDAYVFGMHRSSFLKAMVEKAGGVMLAAHPYRRQFTIDQHSWTPPYEEQVARACENPGLHLADAVETLNGRGTAAQNAFSRDVCQRRGLPAFGASDVHEARDIGRCATRFQQRIAGLEDLIAALKAGRFQPMDLKNGHGTA
jgi:hypothetical protein